MYSPRGKNRGGFFLWRKEAPICIRVNAELQTERWRSYKLSDHSVTNSVSTQLQTQPSLSYKLGFRSVNLLVSSTIYKRWQRALKLAYFLLFSDFWGECEARA